MEQQPITIQMENEIKATGLIVSTDTSHEWYGEKTQVVFKFEVSQFALPFDAKEDIELRNDVYEEEAIVENREWDYAAYSAPYLCKMVCSEEDAKLLMELNVPEVAKIEGRLGNPIVGCFDDEECVESMDKLQPATLYIEKIEFPRLGIELKGAGCYQPPTICNLTTEDSEFSIVGVDGSRRITVAYAPEPQKR